MEVIALPLDRAGEARGTVVVVDVRRAFTTAAVAVDRDAAAVVLTAEVDEARALRLDLVDRALPIRRRDGRLVIEPSGPVAGRG